MRRVSARVAPVLATACVITIAGGAAHHWVDAAHGSVQPEDPDLDRIREATRRYRNVRAAARGGYRATDQCVASRAGGMGYHFENPEYMDDRLEIERPEILVYAPSHSGMPTLAGVEYVVPYSVRPRSSEPPRILGQTLKPADQLQLWYLHVWVWEANPEGMFADWNPKVRCPQ